MIVLIECLLQKKKKWELLKRSISLMHNIFSGDIFLGLEKVKNLWEERIFWVCTMKFLGGVKLPVLLHYEIGMKVVMKDLDE